MIKRGRALPLRARLTKGYQGTRKPPKGEEEKRVSKEAVKKGRKGKNGIDIYHVRTDKDGKRQKN